MLPSIQKLNGFLQQNFRLVSYALAGSALVLLVLIATWVFQLNQTVEEKLRTKRFLPPTEYYSAPLEFEKDMAAAELQSEFDRRAYRPRTGEQKLFPGDYSKLSNEECQKVLPSGLPQATETCWLWSLRENSDPSLNQLQLQMAAVGGEHILEIYKGNPLTATERVYLEPELIAQFLGSEPIMQTPVAIGEVPTKCLNALLAIEDAKFLEHSGVSYTGMARAAIKNLVGSGVRQGGSTITQQLVKNYFLTSERTFKRKVTEFFMSLILEAHASKDEILETYLNIIYLGQTGAFQVRGFAAASQNLFSKPLSELKLSECALLGATVASPGLFDPFKKPENAIKRRHLVLARMKELSFIDSTEFESANNDPLPTVSKQSIAETAPYYLNAANKQLAEIATDKSGLKIYLGINLKAQRAAQEALRNQLSKLEEESSEIKKSKAKGQRLEGALLSADVRQGTITAVVGGRSYKLTQFNRAVDSHRQIGSIMKPFVYLAALIKTQEGGKIYDPLTPLQDNRFNYKFDRQSWSPENYGKKYFGQVPAYFALKNSLNAATASLGIEVGLERIIKTSRLLGVHSAMNEVPSLTLGSFELFPEEVLEAYTTLARLGNHTRLSYIRSVINESGSYLFQFQPTDNQVIAPQPVASLISMMMQTINSGTARVIRNLGFDYFAAGKTGTTSDYRDAWFSGFTAKSATVVWVGFDDNQPTGLTGASGSAPIWAEYMKAFATRYPNTNFSWPESSEVVSIKDDQDHMIELVFTKGAPRSTD